MNFKKIGLMFVALSSLTATSLNAEGTNGNEIDQCQDLTNVKKDQNYYLSKDIDCGNYNLQLSDFNAELNGNGYTISNLKEQTALFNILGKNANIHDLTISNATIEQVNKEQRAAVLANINRGTINNVKVTDSTVDGFSDVGGFIGQNEGTLKNVTLESSKITGANDDVGGMIGDNQGTISNAVVRSGVTIKGRQHTGGIAGLNRGSINEVQVIGGTKAQVVQVNGKNFVGGIVGDNQKGTIKNAVSDTLKMKVNSNLIDFKENYNFGGVVGKNQDNGQVIDSSSSNTDLEISGHAIGGFVGQNDGKIINSYLNDQTIEGNETTGGFVGENYGSINGVIASDLAVTGLNQVGGFAGYSNNGTIENANLSNTSVDGGDFTGGFIGQLDSSYRNGWILKSNVDGNSTVKGNNYTGGFIGLGYGDLTDTYSTASVNGNNYVGGYAGELGGGSRTNRAYGSGMVDGFNDHIGSFAGNLWSNASVDNCLSVASVSGFQNVGAFVGGKNSKAKIIDGYYYDQITTVVNSGDEEIVYGTPTGAGELTTSQFYTNNLNYSPEVWDLVSSVSADNLPKFN